MSVQMKGFQRRSLLGALVELRRQMMKHPMLYIMLIPALAYLVVFKYVPMLGIQVAFRDFRATGGIWGSQWIGLRYFGLMFRDNMFWRAVRNTVIISLLHLVVGFPFPIILALLFNEFRAQKIRNTVQTIIYLPHFLTWVVIAGLINNLFSPDSGTFSQALTQMGIRMPGLLTDPSIFRWTLVVSSILKEGGWSSIIYMAAIASINPEMYEAAYIDGANRWQQMIYLTLPCLAPTVIIMLILALGGILDGGFGQIIVLYNRAVMPVADIIDTLIYRKSLVNLDYIYGTAAGLFKSTIGAGMILGTNALVKRLGGDGMF